MKEERQGVVARLRRPGVAALLAVGVVLLLLLAPGFYRESQAVDLAADNDKAAVSYTGLLLLTCSLTGGLVMSGVILFLYWGRRAPFRVGSSEKKSELARR